MKNKRTTLTPAEHIAALLAHPDTPEIVHNDLAEWLVDAAAPVIATFDKSSGFIQQVLDHHAEIDEHGEDATTEDDGTEDAEHNNVVIARHVSAILEHPDTPLVLRERILDALAMMYTEADWCPRHIAFILDTAAKGESVEGGAR